MDMLTSLVSDVEDAVANGDPTRRVETLRRMTDLFIEQAPHLADLHVAVFDEVILRLARGIEFRVRVELSERLADLVNAPAGVLRDLAFDDEIAVARPVLERAVRLGEDDLAEVAASKSQEHLLALTRRARLSARITEILVDRGDERVVCAVAGNEGAALSDRSLSCLVEKARGDEGLQSQLQARASLGNEQLQQLVAIAREKARVSMRAALGGLDGLSIDAAAFDDAVDDAAEDVARTSSYKALVDDFADAAKIVTECAGSGALDEETIAGWARDGRIEEALAAIAHLAHVPPTVVARAFHSNHYDPLLFILRSLRFGWSTFKTFLVAKAGRDLTEEVHRSAFAAFQQLSVSTAQRIVRFTAMRERTLEAEAL
ncbi:DUF2336 domain-containing protein [Salinarimonas chemoclinalis]|uniref:DUF2336 domain-containing protein n=1 Tax=Salinarimonas chemoclinalis TaxID=3241599 RepID=UPI003558A1CF